MKYIIVTGGSGFIGSALIAHLNHLGETNIVVVDDFDKSEKWKNLVGKQFAEILHKDELFSFLGGKEEKITAFFHLGACSDTMEKDSHFLLENNYRYSQRLAQYALAHGIRFIYASSAATYGDGSLGFSDDHETLESLRPLNMYGYSKHLFDLWLKKHNGLNKVVGLKYFNVFGPNESHKGRMASAVLKMVPDALSKGKISLFQSTKPHYKDGDQVRDFIYIKDAVRMTGEFLTNTASGLFNIGTGKPRTWNDLARSVIRALDKKIEIEYIPMPQELEGKYQYYTNADMTKSKELHIEALFSLEDAVEDYVRNYLLVERYL